MLRIETLRQQDSGLYEEPEGEFLEVVMQKPNKLRVLTRVADTDDSSRSDDESLAESDADMARDVEENPELYEAMAADPDDEEEDDEELVVDADEKTPICGEPKSDGDPCTREVSEPGELCWQHEEDED